VGVSSSVESCRLQAGDFVATKRLVPVKKATAKLDLEAWAAMSGLLCCWPFCILIMELNSPIFFSIEFPKIHHASPFFPSLGYQRGFINETLHLVAYVLFAFHRFLPRHLLCTMEEVRFFL
jgi:hypothetical protein